MADPPYSRFGFSSDRQEPSHAEAEYVHAQAQHQGVGTGQLMFIGEIDQEAFQKPDRRFCDEKRGEIGAKEYVQRHP